MRYLVYSSQSSDGVGVGDIDDILHTSRAFNAEHDITGMLLFKKGYFFQVLEGRGEVIWELFNRIKDDPRNCNVDLVWFDEEQQRVFRNWSMGVCDPDVVSDESRALKEFFSLNMLHLRLPQKQYFSEVLIQVFGGMEELPAS